MLGPSWAILDASGAIDGQFAAKMVDDEMSSDGTEDSTEVPEGNLEQFRAKIGAPLGPCRGRLGATSSQFGPS